MCKIITSDSNDQSFRNVLAALTSRDHGLSGDIDMFLRLRMFCLPEYFSIMLIVVNPIRNLYHNSFAILHKLNYESHSMSIVFIFAYSLFIDIIHVQCTLYIVQCTLVHTNYSATLMRDAVILT